ncbi:MAG: DNA integrity scanning protein DisA nucleotide-binding domain protein, partial [Bacteroidota bacterium]
AVIIKGDMICAARCILPVSGNANIQSGYGLRHRSAIGITERSDALAIIVSEERGQISFSVDGRLKPNVSPSELVNLLEKFLNS